jgi:hypothetical protein
LPVTSPSYHTFSPAHNGKSGSICLPLLPVFYLPVLPGCPITNLPIAKNPADAI